LEKANPAGAEKMQDMSERIHIINKGACIKKNCHSQEDCRKRGYGVGLEGLLQKKMGKTHPGRKERGTGLDNNGRGEPRKIKKTKFTWRYRPWEERKTENPGSRLLGRSIGPHLEATTNQGGRNALRELEGISGILA